MVVRLKYGSAAESGNCSLECKFHFNVQTLGADYWGRLVADTCLLLIYLLKHNVFLQTSAKMYQVACAEWL